MADVHSPALRSKNMQAIRGKDTVPEILMRKLLFSRGLRFRLHVRDLPGKPDIVLPRFRTVIFVQGCFWHGHDCYRFKLPKTRTDFWLDKINSNRARDQRNIAELKLLGWRVVDIWECAIIGPFKQDRDVLANELVHWIRSDLAEIRAEIRHRPFDDLRSVSFSGDEIID